MKSVQSLGHLAAVVLVLAQFPAVHAWPSWMPPLDSLIVRAPVPAGPTSTSTSQGSPQYTSSSTTATPEPGQNTAVAPTGNQTSTKTDVDSHPSFAYTDPVGSVVMISPAITAASQLYKVNDWVTFEWNYTNLLGTPTAVDVLVTCSAATRTWTIAQNMSFATNPTVLWDTSTETSLPLLTNNYGLVIYDADTAGVTQVPSPGYLAPFQNLQFGMYTTQAYTALADGYICATCSGALSDTERRALGFALTMAVITVLSFTWFVTGLW